MLNRPKAASVYNLYFKFWITLPISIIKERVCSYLDIVYDFKNQILSNGSNIVCNFSIIYCEIFVAGKQFSWVLLGQSRYRLDFSTFLLC